ncbi:uncharacterized protein LOC107304794 [Oryza brachyantha]|uniref:uncharacterized protein LOC107304794 n=1 Tax=Oryza brachyantha TaxID=4533 RepID=UPI00077687F2|nr:uncharacterized protein LOC107304794 [Oryza brachyantha]
MSNLATMGLLLIMLMFGVSVQQLGSAQSLGSYVPIVGLLGVIFGANLFFFGIKMTGIPASVSLGAMASLTTMCQRHKLAMGPAMMSNLRSTGALVLLFVDAGSVHQLVWDHSVGSYRQLVSLLGVIVGANLIFLSDKMRGSRGPIDLGTVASMAAAYIHHNLAMAGLFTVSSAIIVYIVSGAATGLALSVSLFVTLLLGVAMITLGVHAGSTPISAEEGIGLEGSMQQTKLRSSV